MEEELFTENPIPEVPLKEKIAPEEGGKTIYSPIFRGSVKLPADAHIKGGQTAYNTGEGFFLGYDGTAYKFSIGNSSDTSNLLLWDGTKLIINDTQMLSQPIYGDGSDGDVIISANTNLTRDMYYNDLTVNTGVVLNNAGYRIYVKGTLTNNGTISRNGNNGSNGNAGSEDVKGTGGAGGSALAAGSLPGTIAGSAGGNGGDGGRNADPGENGDNGSVGGAGLNTTDSIGGAGGGGGAQVGGDGAGVGAYTGGIGVACGTAGTATQWIRQPRDIVTSGIVDTSHGLSAGNGGSGGGGGGASRQDGVNGNYGGGGGGAGGSGSPGGAILISAKKIVINSGCSITANGGNGGNGGNGADAGVNVGSGIWGGGGGGGGGGGVGGQGGVIILIYNSLTNDGSITANAGTSGTGGTGGSGIDGGGDGYDGSTPTISSAGRIIYLQN